MNNLLVAQSGGPTAAMNATLVGILNGIQICGKIDKVYGAKNGIVGVIKDNLIDLSRLLGDSRLLNTLMLTPASALGSSRFKLPDSKSDGEFYESILQRLIEYEIKYFIFIGGNDSMDTVRKLSEYCLAKQYDIHIIGAPKTIDNDLCITDHSPGFGSAAKYVAATISEIAYDIRSYPIPSVTIVEIMGRDAGWLTAASALSRLNGGIGADLIYLCERVFDDAEFLRDVREKLEQKPGILIAISEGLKSDSGSYISDIVTHNESDNFGHKYIAGAARVLEVLIRSEIGCKVRSINLNLMQRAAAHIASETDIAEALQTGQKALYCALQGESGRMVAIRRLSNEPYRISYGSVPITDVANLVKKVPSDWITDRGNYVNQKMITYLTPLIQGQVNLKYDNGLPNYYQIYS